MLQTFNSHSMHVYSIVTSLLLRLQNKRRYSHKIDEQTGSRSMYDRLEIILGFRNITNRTGTRNKKIICLEIQSKTH